MYIVIVGIVVLNRSVSLIKSIINCSNSLWEGTYKNNYRVMAIQKNTKNRFKIGIPHKILMRRHECIASKKKIFY